MFTLLQEINNKISTDAKIILITAVSIICSPVRPLHLQFHFHRKTQEFFAPTLHFFNIVFCYQSLYILSNHLHTCTRRFCLPQTHFFHFCRQFLQVKAKTSCSAVFQQVTISYVTNYVHCTQKIVCRKAGLHYTHSILQ